MPAVLTSYTIFVKFKDGTSLKSKRTYQNIIDKQAYAEAVATNVQDTGCLMFRSGQNTDGWVCIPLENILYWSFDYWDPDQEENSNKSALVEDDDDIEEI